MYNIWCEVTKLKLFFPIICLFFVIGDYFLYGLRSDFYFMLVFFVLFMYILLKSVLKYKSLKKNGTIVSNVPYEIISQGNEKIMIVNYTNKNGNNIQLYKRKELGTVGKIINNLPEKGTTSIIINSNNEKEYYVFYPENNLK